MRVEKLKTKRIRLLPIKYWMSDRKRFSKQVNLISNPLLFLKHNIKLDTNFLVINEKKSIQLLSNSLKVYTKILNLVSTVSLKSIFLLVKSFL